MKKFTKKIITFAIFLIGFIAFSYIFAGYVSYAPTEDEVALPVGFENKKIELQIPISQNENKNEFSPKLTIPALRIDAKIQSVGINTKGNMSTPSNFVDVGLYQYGATPGEKGSAVMAGHVDNKFGLKAVFGNLKNIKIGDEIYVEMEPGVQVKFTVILLSYYDFDARADEVFTQNDQAYLKLITCSGKWVKEYGTHDKRLVVTAIRS